MSDKPVITPVTSILKDDKAVLGLIGLAVAFVIQAVPTLAPAANILTVLTFILFSFLVGHQGVEDIITALGDYRLSIAPGRTTTTIVPAADATVVKVESAPSQAELDNAKG